MFSLTVASFGWLIPDILGARGLNQDLCCDKSQRPKRRQVVALQISCTDRFRRKPQRQETFEYGDEGNKEIRCCLLRWRQKY